MKKIELDKSDFANAEVLSREQMKNLKGGVEPVFDPGGGGDYSCSVSCNSGKFACCNPGSVVGQPTCKCHDEGGSPAPACKNGGSGASSCSITVE